MNYTYIQKTWWEQHFNHVMVPVYVAIVIFAIYTVISLKNDFKTLPADLTGSGAHWLDRSTETAESWEYYGMDGHELAAVSQSYPGKDFRAYVFCKSTNQSFSDHDFDTMANAKVYVEKSCDIGEIED